MRSLIVPSPLRIAPSSGNVLSTMRGASVMPSMSSATALTMREPYAVASAGEIDPSRSRSTSISPASAMLMPGVRSSSIRTRPGSIARRAACRYSSRRCADVAVPAASAASSARAARRLLRELRTVVVGRVAVDGVDVIDAAALRRVLDHQRRALDAEIRGRAVLDRTTPGEIRLRQVAADFRHPRLRVGAVHDSRPLADDVEQHRLLRGAEG